ncbi:7-carboxy-7-deazaguanine synthase QueE, partial [bacterium]|nr:7-carboxy-7-deazaguanine synthase QueE [bacterium]
MVEKANLVEVFESIQGEGLYLGERQLFVRFAGCNLRCKFCDTTYALEAPAQFKWEVGRPAKAGAPKWEVGENPISTGQLVEIIKRFGASYHSISLTGGEPLLQADFIKELLSLLPTSGYPLLRVVLLPTYLETNGTLPQEFKKIVDKVNIISMDIKLPSSTGLKGYWQEYEKLLRLAKRKEIFVKLVVTKETIEEDVKKAYSLVAKVNPAIPIILQPASNSLPSFKSLLYYQSLSSHLKVRIIPQVHKLM